MHQVTLCTLNYHILHFSVTFTVMFNEMLLHMTNIYILLRRSKLKRPKHPFSKNKTQFFFTFLSLSFVRAASSPNSDFFFSLSTGSSMDEFHCHRSLNINDHTILRFGFLNWCYECRRHICELQLAKYLNSLTQWELPNSSIS